MGRVSAGERVRVVLQGRHLSVRGALTKITAELAEAGVGEADRAALELVLAEVLTNIVKHAFTTFPSGSISVEVRTAADRLVCEVADDGAPMPRGTLPPGRPPPLDGALDDLPEGGFGWLLIRELARDLDYGRAAGLNRLRFSLPLARGSRPELTS